MFPHGNTHTEKWCFVPQSESLLKSSAPSCSFCLSSGSLSLSQSFMDEPIMKSSLRTLHPGFCSFCSSDCQEHTRAWLKAHNTLHAQFYHCPKHSKCLAVESQVDTIGLKIRHYYYYSSLISSASSIQRTIMTHEKTFVV